MPVAALRSRPAAPAPKAPAPAPARTPASTPARAAAPTPAVARAGPPAGPALKLVAAAEKDPRFKNVVGRLNQTADKLRQHPPSVTKAAEAQAAAQPSANERLAGAQANKVDAMQAAEPGKKPDSKSFLDMLRAEIQKVMPRKTEDAKDFMKGDDRRQLKAAMTGNVQQQKAEATGAIESASREPADPTKVQGKPVTPLPSEPAPPGPPPLGASEAMPERRPESEVSLQPAKQQTDKLLRDADVTPQQLQKANDPRFSAVLTAKGAADRYADTAPQGYRAVEQGVLAEAATKATADERQALAGFQAVKGRTGTAVRERQLSAKQKDEVARQKVVADIQGMFNKTKDAVDKKLASLETEVSSMFDRGADAAVQKMRDYVDKRFEARYSGIEGKALWVKDKLLPLPPEVKTWFDLAHQVFQQELDALVVQVANLVETRLNEAKKEIERGQREIHAYVQGLPASLQSVGMTAEKEVQGRFQELSQGVDEKRNDLAQKLAQRYKDATEKGTAALKEMRDAHKSLYERVRDTLKEVAEALRQFKERVMAMLRKGQETIRLIVADPIQFLKNLLAAIAKGVRQFVDRIWDHLKQGFMGWLFGSLAETGIAIPKDFSLGSLLMLVLSVLGLTYDRIRVKAVKLIGERNVALIERVAGLIKELITNPARFWETIKEHLSDLKERILDEVQSWLVTTIIKAAVTKLLSMFNPVGAIIQAILMIYNTVMFFIERINQILAFVEAIISSVFNIAIGAIDSAANWIEQALARTIPLIIAFLARLLGITGITEKIQGIIKKLHERVDQAIDKVIGKIMAAARKLSARAFDKKDAKPDERTDAQKQADLDKAVGEGKGLLDDKKLSKEYIKSKLPKIQSHYKLTVLELVTDAKSGTKETDHIYGEINPKKNSATTERSAVDPVSVEINIVKVDEKEAVLLNKELTGKGFEQGVKNILLTESLFGKTAKSPGLSVLGGKLGEPIQARFPETVIFGVGTPSEEAKEDRKEAAKTRREILGKAIGADPREAFMVFQQKQPDPTDPSGKRFGIPDATLKLFAEKAKLSTVILVEITLVTSITKVAEEHAVRKASQLDDTVRRLKAEYKDQFPIEYHLITPILEDKEQTENVRKFLESIIKSSGLKNLKIVWTMLTS